VLKSRRR